MNNNNYNMPNNNKARKLLIFLLILIAAAGIVYLAALNAGAAAAEDRLARMWILCKPGSQVTARRTPSKTAMEVGYLECGDWILVDGVTKNGYARVYGVGEYGEAWVYSGYIAEEEPVEVNMTYCCVAPARVACRRWMYGPKTSNPWLKNGSTVRVYSIAGEWAVTARGYIKSEYLEADPQ